MNMSRDVSPLRPLLFGAIVGLLIGLAFGLFYAWNINPAIYADGAHPHELSDRFQKEYVGAVAEAYLTNRDAGKAASRLTTFAVQDKVRLLAAVATDFSSKNLANEANGVAGLAQQLKNQEGWSTEDITAGLGVAGAPQSFSEALGQVPVPATQPVEGEPVDTGGGGGFGRTLLWIFLVLLVIVIGFILLTRIKPKRKSARPPLSPELAAWDGSGPQPLRQWVGTYTIGQDNYDESFTVETSESDFLGECGMGILEGFSSGAPKKVLAFDVWLFDKTDIRTISMPIMSKFAFEDDVLRGKLPPDAIPVLATEGQIFDIETTALIIKAKIEEVVYGDDQPPMSYFTTLKVSLTAFLKPDVDVSGVMAVPDGFSSV